MKTNRLAVALLAAMAVISVERAGAQALDLSALTTGSSGVYTNTFDSLGYSTNQTVDGTPTGTPGYLEGEWTCYTNATVNYYGTVVAGAPNLSSPGTMNVWTNPFTGGFFNYASYFDYTGGTNFYTNGFPTDATYGVITNGLAQTNEPNRCLGIRQIGAFGDPGAAIVLKLANTLPYNNFKLWVDLMNLDPTSPRETTWQIQYGVADPFYGVPTAFTTFSVLGKGIFLNTPGSNHVTHVNFSCPAGTINNIDGQVWIRIVTLDTSSGSGNRQTFAMDNFGLTWSVGSSGCTPVNSPTIIPPSPPVYSNSTVSFIAGATGSQTKSYQWRYNGVAIGQVFPSQVVGLSDRSSVLTLQNVTAANQGNYDCIISNACSGTVTSVTTPIANMTVVGVPSVSLGYLRTLTDSSYAPTVPTTDLYQITGIITTVTNTTSGNTSSYYIQDATGGMNLFVTGGQTFRPQIGDEVTAVGYLNEYQGNLELEADLTGQNNATSVQDLSNNIVNYPVAKVLDWPTQFSNVTNSFVEKGLNSSNSLKGSVCILTNVYFGTNAGHLLTGNYYTYVTNSAGLGGWIYFWAGGNNDVISNTIPAFAYSVQGPLFATATGPVNTNGSFWSGVGVSKWADVVTTPLVLSVTRSGNSSTISWTAVPQTYTYSVLASANAAGPYTVIATDLNFSTSAASYVDVNNAAHQFYRVTSP